MDLHLDCRDALDAGTEAAWAAFHVGARHQHPHQTPRAAATEAALGRKPLYVTGRAADGTVVATGLFTLQPHRLLKGAWSDAYCLSGPVCDNAETMLAFLDATARLPQFRRVGRLRVTPYWTGDAARSLQHGMAARRWRSTETETFRQTGWIDLQPPPGAIFAAFSKSARREVRRAERQGVICRPLRDEDEALQFLHSLNRLYGHRRGLATIPPEYFLAEFREFGNDQDVGTVLGAFHNDQFLAGLLIVRSRLMAHSSRFATEPDRLHNLGNLRIAPFLWFQGMLWARERGCRAVDVEGWAARVAKNHARHNIYKYKAEFAPDPVLRIGEHGLVINRPIDMTSNAKAKLMLRARRLKHRLYQ